MSSIQSNIHPVAQAARNGDTMILIRTNGKVCVGVFSNGPKPVCYILNNFKEAQSQECTCGKNCPDTVYMYDGCSVRYGFCLEQVGVEYVSSCE